MPEISYEDAVGIAAPELSYEDAIKTVPVAKPALRGPEMTYEQAQEKASATYGGAISASFIGGVRQAVGGGMEAAGDVLAPKEISYEEAFAESQRNGPSVIGAITSVAETTRKKLTSSLAPAGTATNELGQNLQGAGAELGDQARTDIQVATPDDLNMAQEAGISIVNSVGQMVPWLAAGRLGMRPGFVKAGALTQFGGLSGGQTYNEAKAGGASPEDALSAAALSGGAEAAGEMLGLGTALKMRTGWFKRFVAQEIGGEEFTTVIQSLTEKAKYNPQKWSSSDEVIYDLALTALSAAGGAGVMGGANHVMDRLVSARKETTFSEGQAQTELNDIFTRALDPNSDGSGDRVPLPLTPMTKSEIVQAAIGRAQRAGGVATPGTPEAQAFGAQITEILARNRAAGITVVSEVEENLDEGGVTPGVVEGRARRYDPSELDAGDRPIRFIRDEKAVGLTLNQVGDLPAGAVAAIGGNESNFPTPVYSKLTEDLTDWVAKYMPEARIILNLEQFAPEHQATAFGMHQLTITRNGLLHIITPRDLPGFKYEGGDQKTQAALLNALAHEFGHALKMQTLFQGISRTSSPEIAKRLLDEIAQDSVSPKTLAAVAEAAPVEAAMIGTWMGLRQSVLDGTMTAQDFIDQWAGVRKVGFDNYKTKGANKSLYSWAKAQLAQAGKGIDGATAQELLTAGISDPVEAQAHMLTQLSLDEYMAEQFSRAAWTGGDIENSRAGGLFANALGKLRQLFRDLKSWRGTAGETIIAPGTTFQAWIDQSLTRAKAAPKRSGKITLSPAIKKARRELLKKAKLAEKLEAELAAVRAEVEAETPPPEQGEIPAEVEATQLPTRERLLEVLAQLESDLAFEDNPRRAKAIKGYITRGEYQTALEKIEDTVGDFVSWDRDYSSKVLKSLPNKEKIKAETLRMTLKRADLKKAEKLMWEGFLADHPEGFSLEEAKAALLANVMPLTPAFTEEHADLGVYSVGLVAANGKATSVIWEAPVDTGGSEHYPEHSRYLLHSRRFDVADQRFILELQSDLFQHDGELAMEDPGYTDALGYQAEDIKPKWWERLIREEVTAAFEDGRARLYFPTADTVAAIEGWQSISFFEEYAGLSYEDFNGRMVTLTGEMTVGADTDSIIAQVEAGGYTPIDAGDSAAAAAIVKNVLARPRVYTGTEKIYERYRSAISKFIKSNYQTTLVTISGRTWLKVDPKEQGSTVLNWDRDNPVQPPHPEITLANFAGMTEEEYRLPAVVAQASAMWTRLGFDSPFFKRWGGQTKVLDAQGKPLGVWRGVGDKVSYLDSTTRGASTGAQSARKAFWFAENYMNAAWYMDKSKARLQNAPKEEFRRRITELNRQLEDLQELAQEESLTPAERKMVQTRILRKLDEKTVLTTSAETTRPAQPGVQEFYLNMVNPLKKDALGQSFDDKIWTGWLQEALAAGHDGLVIENGHDPLDGAVYAIFEPMQAKLSDNIGTFDPTDSLHWDRNSPNQQTVRGISKMMSHFWEKGKLRTLNTAAKGMDYMLQLQQIAASQPDNIPLNSFIRLQGLAGMMKNRLQVDAEQLVKEMLHESSAVSEKLHAVLRAEHVNDVLMSTLVGKDVEGNVVWGDTAPTDHEARRAVVRWEVQDSLRLRKFLDKQGVDLQTRQGKKVLEFYLRSRNVFLLQFTGLEIALKAKALNLYENSPSILKQELWKIEDLLSKFRGSPFLPQGNFGNYVVIWKKDRGPQGRGKRRFVPVRKQHFESKTDFQIALKEAQSASRGDPLVKVSSQILKENDGIPMQLPNDFLESLGQTGMFNDEQLELMADMMTKVRYEKLEAKYDQIASKMTGANNDFTRVFADYTLRNSNFIWKMYYRTAFRGAISQARTAVRGIEKDKSLAPGTQMKLLERERRNIGAMENSLNAMLYPESEFQKARLAITMVYLAYNPKTAIMNAGTMLNAWAALSSEYGEWKGNKAFAQGLKDAASIFMVGRLLKTASQKERVRLNEIRSVYDRAMREGVLDQSYAYFLAGQSTASSTLDLMAPKWSGKVGHLAMEVGMFPFKAVEKANRLGTLLAFYHAERAAGNGLAEAYQIAVQKTDLLQNSYSQGNKPKLLQGKKSILFMFGSFTLFQGWILTGGYERASRTQMRSMGRTPPSVLHGTTMKLWVLYGMLGGLLGLPFAENLMDLLQFIWRKFFGGAENLTEELRGLIQDLTGDSNVAMSGLLHNAGGFDLSGSFGFGRPIPGTDLLNREWKTPAEAVGNLGLKFAGPAGGFYSGLAKAIGEFTSGNFGEGLKNIPGAVGAVSKAIDAKLAQEDQPGFGVTTKTGVRLTFDKKLGDFRDLTTGELFGMAMGATPTLLSQNREVNSAIVGEGIYWQTRRGDLLDKAWRAKRTEDDKMRESVQEAIEKYNDVIPDPSLRITGKDLAVSLRNREKAARLAEVWGTAQKKQRGISGDIREGFGEEGRR